MWFKNNFKKILLFLSLLLILILTFLIFFKKSSGTSNQGEIPEIFFKKENGVLLEEKTNFDQKETQPTQNQEKIPSEPLPSFDPESQEKPKETSNPSGVTSQANETNSPSFSDSKIIDNFVSWGFETAKNRKIDTLILHSSYDALTDDVYSVQGVIKEYKQYGVAPHFLINRQGTIYQLVREKDIAYHAGQSQVPDGRKAVNDFSIGIELLNTQKDSFTDKQYASLKKLIAYLKKKYSIKYILGHNQIAPGRKTDPWNFDWKKID